MEKKTVRFIITRQDSPDSQPYEEEFELEYRPNMTINSSLMEIQRNPVQCQRGEGGPGRLGVQLFGGGLRCLLHGDQRYSPPGLLHAGGLAGATDPDSADGHLPGSPGYGDRPEPDV